MGPLGLGPVKKIEQARVRLAKSTPFYSLVLEKYKEKAEGKLTKKRNCKPYTMELILRTGFQSSLKMLRQTLPSKSIFGW